MRDVCGMVFQLEILQSMATCLILPSDWGPGSSSFRFTPHRFRSGVSPPSACRLHFLKWGVSRCFCQNLAANTAKPRFHRLEDVSPLCFTSFYVILCHFRPFLPVSPPFHLVHFTPIALLQNLKGRATLCRDLSKKAGAQKIEYRRFRRLARADQQIIS